MKTCKMFQIAMLAIVLSIGVGCSSDKFAKVGDPIIVGNKEYVAILTERVQPWGGNATTLSLVESELEQNAPPVINQYGQVVQCQAQGPRTRVVNNNNQGSIGWANGAFQGSVGAAVAGAEMMGAAALIRPSRISNANGGSACSSSSAAATAQ